MGSLGLGFPGAGGGFLFAFADAVALAFDHGDIGVVGEAVQQGGDHRGVGEHGIPVLEGAVGGEQQGAVLLAEVDDFVEQVSGLGVVGEITDLVDGQQGGEGPGS